MDRWNGKVVVVSGASSGIGEAVVRKLFAYGMKVVALARREERLQKLEAECVATNGHKGTVKGLKCDVTNENEVNNAFSWVEQNWGAVHVIVNNAAILTQAPLNNIDVNAVGRLINTNIVGTLTTLKYALKSMEKHSINNGHVIFINSTAGHEIIPLTGMSPYCASKHAISVLAKSLNNELAFSKSGIRTTSISPGLVDTEMVEPFRGYITKDTPILKTNDVVEAIVYVLSAPQHVNVSEVVIQPTGESTALTIAGLLKAMQI